MSWNAARNGLLALVALSLAVPVASAYRDKEFVILTSAVVPAGDRQDIIVVTKRPSAAALEAPSSKPFTTAILEAYRTSFAVTSAAPRFEESQLLWRKTYEELYTQIARCSAAIASDSQRVWIAISNTDRLSVYRVGLNAATLKEGSESPEERDTVIANWFAPPQTISKRLREIHYLWMHNFDGGLLLRIEYEDYLREPGKRFWMILRYDLANESWLVLAESDKP